MTSVRADKAMLKTLIPDKELDEFYIGRTYGGIWDRDVLKHAREKRYNVILKGPTGSAKTTMVESYAAREGLPVVTIPGQRAGEPEHYFGSYHSTDVPGVYKWTDGPVTLAARYGGVVYLDEVNFVPPSILAVLHPALDYRRKVILQDKGNEVIEVHPDFQVVASYNPRYRGTFDLGEAFSNRYAITMKVDYSTKIEEQLVRGMPTLVEVATSLRMSVDNGELNTPITTNSLMEFEDLAVDLGFSFAQMNYLSRFEPEEEQVVTKVFELFETKLKEELTNYLGEEA